MENKFTGIENPAEEMILNSKKRATTEKKAQEEAPSVDTPKHVPNPKGRPKAEKPKSKRIGLVAEPDLYAQMEAAAEKMGISVAGLIRQSVIEKLASLEKN